MLNKKIKLKIADPTHKELAIKYLYKDWKDYKKYFKSKGFIMKEGFISYLSREASNLDLIPLKDNH